MGRLETNNVQVYFHFCISTQEVFYVGIGISTRPWDRNRSKFWHSYVRKHGPFEVQIVYSDMHWNAAANVERQYIQFFGRRNTGSGSLVNLTDGGDGTVGFVHSEEFRRKMSQIPRSTQWKARISESNRGKTISPKSIEKMKRSMSERMSGVKNPRSKYYKVLSPRGFTYEIFQWR